MATNIKGGKLSDVYQRLFFRSTTGDISTGTSAQYLTTSVQATGVAVDSILSFGTERVGIGTASPAQMLNISGATDPAILVTDTTAPCSLIMISQNTSASVGTTTAHSLTLNTNNSAKMTILSAGNVGIGTSGPDNKLDILDASNPQLRLTHTDGSKYATFQVDTNHDLLVKPSSTGQVKLQPTTDSTDFFQVLDANGGTPVLNVDSTNERVGIGKSGPTTALDIAGTVTCTDILITDASAPGIVMTDTTNTCVLAVGASDTVTSIGNVSAHNMNFLTSSAIRATVTSAGKIGIGTETPASTLDVEGNVAIGATYSGSSAAPGNGLLVQGDVGIGTISPAGQLTVAGGEGGDGIINLWADEGDDNADKWKIEALTTGPINISSYATGSWVKSVEFATNGSISGACLKDEDNMASNSATHIATQQSVKAYVDTYAKTFYMNVSFYQRISASNVYIASPETNMIFATGGTSLTSIDAEALIRGSFFQANKNTTFVGATGWIGDATGAGEDLTVSFLLSNAYTSDQTGNFTTTSVGSVSQAGALTADDAYYVSTTVNQAMTAGQNLLVGVALGTGSNKYICFRLTLEFLITA